MKQKWIALLFTVSLIMLVVISQMIPSINTYATAAYTAVSVATGTNHSCALTTDGSVKCWGRNDFGQLGNGSTSSSGTGINSPVDVSGLTSGVSAIAAGGDHTCAIMISDGSVKCWGANGSGQLGDSSTTDSNTPVTVSGLIGITAIGLGDSHSCAITATGGLKCWGWDYYGQVDGSPTYPYKVTTPVDVGSLSNNVTGVVGGFDFTCVIVSGGAKCWGGNTVGQLGTNDNTQYYAPQDVYGFTSGVSKIVASYQTACALTSGGAVKCWGWNDQGQLGNNSQTNSNAPVQVNGLTSGVSDISLGTRFACALITSSHAAKCWGINGSYQLGKTGGNNPELTPVDSNLTSSGAALSSGANHTCALIDTGDIRCWGANDYGQLGSSDNFTYYIPHDVVGFSGNGAATLTPTMTFTPTASLTPTPAAQTTGLAMAAGTNHACAITTLGTVKCWGRNDHGQLGAGFISSSGTGINSTIDVSGLSGVIAIAAGGDHTCVIVTDHTMKCWGADDHGQLGDGSATDSDFPVTVSGLSGVTGMGLGEYHTCAILTGGGLKCWGWDYYGQLGNGSIPSTYPYNITTPTDVSGLNSGVTQVSAGFDFTCATVSGAAKCWGNNNMGQLGDTTNSASASPVSVSGLSSGVTKIVTGYEHACAIVSSGVKCWGWNDAGELGDGSYSSTGTGVNTPVDVSGLTSGVSDISVGTRFSCAVIESTGGVKCWGVGDYAANGSWQLGVNSGPGQFGSNTPVDSTLSSGVAAIDSGANHSCALISGGDIKCWGDGGYGQIGNGHSFITLAVNVVGFSGNSVPTATPTTTYTPAPTNTATSTPTETNTPTQVPTNTPMPTNTSTSTATSTSTSTSTSTATSTATITSTFTPSPTATFTITPTATATSMPLSLSTASLSFGIQLALTTSATQSVTVTNTSGADLTLGTLSGNSIFLLASNTCDGVLLHASNTCTFGVAFKPISASAYSGQITIPYGSNFVQLPLSGTGVAGTQLLTNESFNLDTNKNKVPDGWTKGGTWATADGYNTGTKRSGTASLKFTGTKILKTLSFAKSTSGVAGDDFLLTLWSKATSVPTSGTTYSVTLKFSYSGTPVGTQSVNFAKGTHNFAKITLAFTAPADYTKVQVVISFKATAGMAYFDDASLLWAP